MPENDVWTRGLIGPTHTLSYSVSLFIFFCTCRFPNQHPRLPSTLFVPRSTLPTWVLGDLVSLGRVQKPVGPGVFAFPAPAHWWPFVPMICNEQTVEHLIFFTKT